ASCPRASFVGATLTYADFSHCDLEGADFTHAAMFRTKLHRARRNGARVPSGAGFLGDDEKLAALEDWKPQRGGERDA
ncbi:MAG: pentapeptide repeat-containing protein, partial [Polyangiaceae bacterium]|nr:pentapeptide repeat-containing protein [Polyangiaceae bacterium]